MIDRTDLAVATGVLLAVALGALLVYQLALYLARRDQRGMSTRQRQRRQHWAIRIDDALRSRRQARNHAAERRALRKRRRSR